MHTASVCMCVCDRVTDRYTSVRARGSNVWGHEGLQPAHIPALHTPLKAKPLGFRWAQISVCQKCNWRNLKIHPSFLRTNCLPPPREVRPINWGNDHGSGPISIWAGERTDCMINGRWTAAKGQSGSWKDKTERPTRLPSRWNTVFAYSS